MYASINQPLTLFVVVGLLLAGTLTVAAQPALDLPPPAHGYFILDHAGLLSQADAEAVDETTLALASEKAVPLYVVTIESMAAHGGDGLPIERFARRLYEQWGNTPEFEAHNYWRQGILLLISREDRKARIELGANWGGQSDGHCEAIMSGIIIPAFKQGDYSTGIRGGVEALDAMSRGEPPPPRTSMSSETFLGLISVGLILILVLIGVLARILQKLLPPRSRGYDVRADFNYIDRHGGQVNLGDAFRSSSASSVGHARPVDTGYEYSGSSFGGDFGGSDFGGGGGGASGSW